ncbi:FecR family protein [Persicitalea sp.]|uniref:FecR family protein n=1 Tax=Persicitalea sp. TaxID=3100273 RepID=UPI0035942D1A
MKNYEHYTAEDFIRDESFRDWVQGRSQEESFWPNFLQKNPDKKRAMQEAERVIRAGSPSRRSPVEENLTEREIRQEVQRFLANADSASEKNDVREFALQQKSEGRSTRWPMLRYLTAAIVLLALGMAWYFSNDLPISPETTSTERESANLLVETSNPTSEPLRLRLGDDSEVILSPNSRLSYPAQFADSARIVYLTGEASFSVERQERPFLVVTGEMVTKVLGTQFVVRAFAADKKFSVQVVSGKVSVSRAEPGRVSGSREVNGLILTANQAAIFEKDLRHLSKTLVANPIVVEDKAISHNPDFRYDETPLPTILAELERRYGIAIQFDEPSLRNCRITATFTTETLYEQLDILCKTGAATYEIVDGQIVVSGRGCR